MGAMSQAGVRSSSPREGASKAKGESTQVGELHVRIEQVDGFEFLVRFDKEHWRDFLVDEPAPLGRDTGPNAPRVLAAAIGNCLSASLLFCLARADVFVGAIDADVVVEMSRNERHRLRIPKIRVTLWPTVAEASEQLARCLDEFQDYCVVTESVREGIEVVVNVQPIIDGIEGPSS